MKIEIIFEDQYLIAVNKPKGLPSQPLNAGDSKPNAVSEVLKVRPELQKTFPDSIEPGLLHRLDIGTSGVLLFAKDPNSFETLKENWKTEKIRKFYQATVTDLKNVLEGLKLPYLIDWPMARSLNHKSRMIVIDRPEMRLYRGKKLEALSRILSFKSALTAGQFEIELEITTGVMHQIRCHLSYLGTPIVGDELYKGLVCDQMQLHATRIEIHESVLGKKYSIKASSQHSGQQRA